MSVVFGIRDNSSTSTVTHQDSPSHSRPVAASGMWPVSSSTVVSAAWASSLAVRFPFSFAFAMTLLFTDSTKCDQAFDEGVFGLLDLFLAVQAGLARGLHFRKAGHDR